VLRRCPDAHILIAGGDGVSYGAPSPPRTTFRDMMLQELGSELDLERIHFVGTLEHADYLSLLQVSSVHVYLTYPFVLSWSFIEALSTGCAIIGSATPPVLEVLRDGENGLTVDFFASRMLAERIESVLEQPASMRKIRESARATALERFDLHRVLLPRWEALFDDLINHRRPVES
jgi:glycosyltransferase involved in cell wall biosynthesis